MASRAYREAMAHQGFGNRVRRAWHRWASQSSEPVTYADFGAALALEEQRSEPYSTSAISEWIAERSEPKARTYRAMAKLSGFRSAWLSEGELPEEGEDNEGGQGAPRPTTTPVAPAPASSRRAHVPLTETEVLETRYLRPKKKQTPKRRPGDKSAVA